MTDTPRPKRKRNVDDAPPADANLPPPYTSPFDASGIGGAMRGPTDHDT